MAQLGTAALLAAFATSLYAGGAALAGARGGDRRWVESSRRAIYALFAMLALAAIVLETAFLRSDFGFKIVADHSSTTTPALYKATAVWGSQAGSLLLWALVLAAAASAVLYLTRNRHREIVPWATAVLAGMAAFFTGLMLAGWAIPGADSFPFATLASPPAEGEGLNPLLRHPAMAIHPPMLYAGYVFFTIPFAFAIGALVTRRLDASWIRSTRRFALIAWSFLSIGLVLGAYWSYNELGWGGYWAWDPVENAALMPWLVGTAFLHSIMVQERRGMLRTWNVSLIVATMALSLLGTFLVRSGVLQSIHAFGESKVGPPLLALIAVVIVGSTALIASRLPDLRSERRLDSLLSRESIFLLNNLLLVGMAAVVFWGTFFPLISEAATGATSSLAAPWFDRVTTPIAIGAVLMAGVGPLVAWRRVSWSSVRRSFGWPAAIAALAGVGLVAFAGAGSRPLALLLFVAAAFTLGALGQEFVRGAGARRALAGGSPPAALLATISRNRRRYGGYIVHIGIAALLIGVAASSSFQTSRDLRLQPGDTAEVADYTVSYERATQSVDSQENKLTFGAVLAVSRDGERLATLRPERNYYSTRSNDDGAPVSSFFEGEATSEVGRTGGLTEDLWTAVQPDLTPLEGVVEEADAQLAELAESVPAGNPQAQAELASIQGQTIRLVGEAYANDPPPADFRVNANPFVAWVWIGGGIGLLGALVASWPGAPSGRRQVSDVYAARLARDLSRP